MDHQARQAIEAECRRLVDSFALCIDAGDYDRVMAMFLPDAHYEPIGHVLDGHAAIRRFLDARPKDRLTLHIMSNIVVEVIDDRQATARSYVSYVNTGRADNAGHEGGGAAFGGVSLIGFYDDAFRLSEAGWRFSQRLCHPVVRRW